MNENIFKGKWKEVKGEVKKRWGKLSDDDLMMISGEKEKLVGLLQTRYGYSKDKAEDEYRVFIEGKK